MGWSATVEPGLITAGERSLRVADVCRGIPGPRERLRSSRSDARPE